MTALAFLAGVLFYWPSTVYLGVLHISLVTGTVYAVVVGVAAALVCVLMPRLRFMIEAVAVSRLVLAFAVAAFPDIGPILLFNPVLMAAVVVAGGFCVSRVMHGPLDRRDQPRFAFGPASHRAAVTRGTPWQRRFVNWIDGAAAQRAAT